MAAILPAMIRVKGGAAVAREPQSDRLGMLRLGPRGQAPFSAKRIDDCAARKTPKTEPVSGWDELP